VGLNNKNDLDKYKKIPRFFFPYGVSKRYSQILSKEKIYDIIFIGSLTPERQKYIQNFNMKYARALGNEYIKLMQESKICFNKSISYDLNAKNLEIIASGTFILTNYNIYLHEICKDNNLIEKIFYKNDEELSSKINYYLKNDNEREYIAKNLQQYIFEKHSYDARIRMLYNKLIAKIS
jgi:spore maturation protein CgeB